MKGLLGAAGSLPDDASPAQPGKQILCVTAVGMEKKAFSPSARFTSFPARIHGLGRRYARTTAKLLE